MHTPRPAPTAPVKRRAFTRPLLGSIAALFTAASLAQGGQIWDGGGANALWSNALNWDGNTLPNFASPLQFGGALQLTPNNDATASVAGLSFLTGAETFDLTGNAITLNGGITVNSTAPQNISFTAITLGSSQIFSAASGALAIISDVDLGANTLTVTGPQNTTFSNTAQITGTGGITKTGTGRLTISGINSYTGTTRIEQGELFANGSLNPFGTGQIVIAGNSRIGSSADNQIIANNISITAATTELVIEANTHLDFTGNVDLNGGTRTLTGTVNQSEINFSGVISNGGVTFGTSGLGSGTPGSSPYVAFIYGGAPSHTYTGLTTVNDGAFLVFTTGGQKIVGDVLIQGTGVVDYLGGSDQISDTATVTVNSVGSTISGGIAFAGLELFNKSDAIGTLLGTGTVGLGSGTLTVGAGNFSGVIGDGERGTGGDLVKDTAGTLILTGANNYTGTTTLTGGTLQIGDGGTTGSLTSPTIVANAGTTLAFNRSDTVTLAGVISGTGTLRQAGTGTLILTGANIATGPTRIASGTLQLGNGGTTGSINSLSVIADAGATLAFNRSNTLGFIRVISGAGGVRQLGSGRTTLSAASTYTGSTVVDGGTLEVTGSLASPTITINAGSFIAGRSGALAATAAATVATGGAFEYRGVADAPLAIGALTLNSGTGTTIGGSLGATFTGAQITVAGPVTPTPGAIRVNVFAIPGVFTGATGTYTLLTAGAGSTLNVGTTYTLGTVFNANNFTIGTPTATATTLTVQISAAVPLTEEYWLGGLPGSPNVWSASNGSTASNWASDPAGTPTPLIPGAGTNVFFSAANATDPGNMTLGQNMSIASLTINAPTAPETRAVTLNRSGSDTLTIATAGGITVNSGAGPLTLNPDLILGASQTWTNNSANVMTIGGAISNGANTLTVAGTGNTLLSGILGNGAGGLIKNGTGRLTVTNDNTYTGDIFLNEGSLFADNPVTGGAVRVLGDGTLHIAGGTTLGSTVSGEIIPNAVQVAGDFTIVTPTIGDKGIILSGNIDLQGGIRTITGTTENGLIVLTSAISNGGITFESGAAAGLMFVQYGSTAGPDQPNTYTGLTTVNSGVALQLRKELAGGALDGAVRGDLLVNAGGSVSYGGSNQIADTSRVTLHGTGVIDQGGKKVAALELGAGSVVGGQTDTIGALFGDGTVGLGFGALTVGRGDFAGVIGDGEFGQGGQLTKNTTGTLTLTGASTFTGNTNINNGTVVLNGSVQSPTVFVNFAGTLMGTGRAGRNVVNAGVFSPGNSTGTFTIGGNFSQNAAGTLVIEIGGSKAGEHDLVAVGGRAELGGTLRLTQVRGARLKVGERVTFLTAAGGVAGEFANVTNAFNNAATLTAATVLYESNAVSVVGAQGSFSDFAAQFGLNSNQRRVATALDQVADNPRQARLITYLNEQLLGELPRDFDRIAPEELQAIYTIGIAQAQVQTTNLQRRLEDIRAGQEGFSAAGLSVSGLQPPADSELPPAPPASDLPPPAAVGELPPVPGATGPTGVPSKELRAPADRRYGAFFTGTGEWVKVGTSSASGYDLTTGGFTLGVDYRINENFAVGVNLGYARTSAELFDDGKVTVDGAKIGAYATYVNEAFYVDATLQGGYNSYDTRRSGLEGSPSGSTTGGEFSTLLAIGYDFKSEKVEGLTFGPVASLQYTYIGIGGFRESGSLAPLDYDAQGGTSFRSTLGAKATYDWRIGGVLVKPELRAAWQHEYGDSAFGIDARFANGGNTFTVAGAEIGRDSLLLGVGVAVLWNERTATYLYYDGEIGRSNYQSNNVSGGVRVAF